jgi:hypothetical protein
MKLVSHVNGVFKIIFELNFWYIGWIRLSCKHIEEEITATEIQNVCIVLPPSKFLDLKVFKHMS